MSTDIQLPFIQRYVPNRVVTDQFVDKFCRAGAGRKKIGIVTGWRLTLDTRPGRGSYLRHLYYGICPTTGRDWQSYSPKVLSLSEMQTLTWAWGNQSAKHEIAARALDDLQAVATTPAMLKAIIAVRTGMRAMYVLKTYKAGPKAAKRRVKGVEA